MENNLSHCSTCGARILWVQMHGGRKNPLNAEPDRQRGNVFCNERNEWHCLAGDELRRAKENGATFYLSHFATCAQAAAHRKKTKTNHSPYSEGA